MVILSQSTRYGLRAVLVLAQHDPKRIQVKDIAEALNGPVHFIGKILQDLSKRGLLSSSKGRGGGFALARPVSEITLLEVVCALEGDDFVGGCILGLPECSDDNPCPLHTRWSSIRSEVLGMFSDKNVMQLLEEISAAGHPA